MYNVVVDMFALRYWKKPVLYHMNDPLKVKRRSWISAAVYVLTCFLIISFSCIVFHPYINGKQVQ